MASKNYIRNCRCCNKQFTYSGRNHWAIRYCSDECRKTVESARLRLHSKKWRDEHPEKVAEWKRLSYQKKRGSYLERSRINGKKARQIRKWQVLTYYSKARLSCACCEEKQIKFLTIDHIFGGGNKQRKELFGGMEQAGDRFYSWLIKNHFPDGFQVLCMNCNFAKGMFGQCPHMEVRVFAK